VVAPVEVIRCEEDLKAFQVEEMNVLAFYKMDNKLIDAYYSKKQQFQEEERDLLEEGEFLFFIQQLHRDLEYIYSLRFVPFWGVITKMPEVSFFLD
jgi:hypothetical protein